MVEGAFQYRPDAANSLPLPVESISDEIIKIVQAAIPVMAAGDSSFYQLFPKFPEFDLDRATAFKKSVEELSTFQAEIIAARSATGDQRRRRALELRDRYHTGGPFQKAVAIELLYTLRDCTDFKTTLEFADKLHADLKNSPVVKQQRALALSKSGNYDDAIGAPRELVRSSGDTSERRVCLVAATRRSGVSRKVLPT